MAKKIGNRKQTQAQQTPEQNSELDILHPEREIMIQGKKITLREYGGIEWLRLQASAAPLIERLSVLLRRGETPAYKEAYGVIADHVDELLPLIAQAADLELETVSSWGPDDLELLIMAWWGCNGRFFINRAINQTLTEIAEEKHVKSAGVKSTPPSLQTGTPLANSNTTPNGN